MFLVGKVQKISEKKGQKKKMEIGSNLLEGVPKKSSLAQNMAISKKFTIFLQSL